MACSDISVKSVSKHVTGGNTKGRYAMGDRSLANSTKLGSVVASSICALQRHNAIHSTALLRGCEQMNWRRRPLKEQA